MNITIGSLCLLLSVPWVSMEPKVDVKVKLAIQEAWQTGTEADKAGISAEESFNNVYEAIKELEQAFSREEMILQCALIAADVLESAISEADFDPSQERPRAYFEALITVERLIEATPLELVYVLGRYWPEEAGFLKEVLRELFGLAARKYRDEGDASRLLVDLFPSVLRDAWSRGDAKYNGLIDYMYSVDPAEAWQVMAELDEVRKAECQALTKQLLPVQTVYRGYHIRNPGRLPEGTEEKARAILHECLECGSLWSKIFVAEVLLRVESMREDELLKVLREDKSPFIVRRVNLIEQEEKQSN